MHGGAARSGVSRAGRIAAAAGFAIPVFLGATIGFFAVREGPELLKLSLLAFTGGILLTIAVEEMLVWKPTRPGGKAMETPSRRWLWTEDSRSSRCSRRTSEKVETRPKE